MHLLDAKSSSNNSVSVDGAEDHQSEKYVDEEPAFPNDIHRLSGQLFKEKLIEMSGKQQQKKL